jgi:phage N-6-adenine-methyltransferase
VARTTAEVRCAGEAAPFAAIEAVDDPEAAEELLARIKLAAQAIRLSKLGADREKRWGRVRLLGERRYGELLGPAEPTGRGSKTSVSDTNAERQARHQARQVADVPEDVFTEYVQEEERPSRAGLLKMAVHYSSQTDEWETPQDLFDQLNAEFNFTLDVCALGSSAKCDQFFSPEDDGLEQEWTGACWMNPPYGDVIGAWVRKARESAEQGATVVCLVPARVDTGWWWDNCRDGEVRFLRGRLKFGGGKNSAPFPSAVVIFSPSTSSRVVWWER